MQPGGQQWLSTRAQWWVVRTAGDALRSSERTAAVLKKILVGIKLMHPKNLREHNINTLLEKDGLTEAELNWLADMEGGGAGSGGQAVDYVEAWKSAR